MRQGVAVVQCTRAARGRVARRRYLEETGIIAGEDFSPQKARILLALGLAMTSDVETLKEWFRRY
jgi:L-asparaginase